MKRLQWAIAMVLLALAQRAYADNISTFNINQVTIPFLLNVDDDNMFFNASGPGVSITGSGETLCENPPALGGWCTQGTQLSSGSSLKPSFFLAFCCVAGRVTIGGQNQVVDSLSGANGFPQITALGSFTFPTNGKSFTVSVPAILQGPLVGQTDAPQAFNLQIPPRGTLVLTFDFFRGSNGVPDTYQLSHGNFTLSTVVPEPGTLGLMVSGLAGILGAVLKKCNCKRPVL
jgi:hypothetical protein